jgi:hypothetical protein
MMLETTFQFPILVLTMTIGCILLLFPFLYFLNRILVFEIGVTKLNVDIDALIESKKRSQILIKLNSLENISKLCIKNDRLYYFSNTLSSYANIVENAKKKKMENVVDIIGLKYIDILLFSIKKSKPKNRKIITMSLFRQINTYITNYSEIIRCTDLELQTFFLKDVGSSIIKANLEDIYILIKLLKIYIIHLFVFRKKEAKRLIQKNLMEGPK